MGTSLSRSSEKAAPSYEDLIALAQKAGAGAGGLICLPLLAGERSPNWDLNARGTVLRHKAKWGMKEHMELLKERGLPVPPTVKSPQIIVKNEDRLAA